MDFLLGRGHLQARSHLTHSAGIEIAVILE